MAMSDALDENAGLALVIVPKLIEQIENYDDEVRDIYARTLCTPA
jgi:hypothetical protein